MGVRSRRSGVRSQRLTGSEWFSDLVAPQVVAVLRQQVGHLLHVDGVVEGCGIANLALIGRNLKANNTANDGSGFPVTAAVGGAVPSPADTR